MKDLQTSILSKKTYSFTILDAIDVDIAVSDNPYLLPLEELLIMAARINKKRSFLFVSKVLGKHLPIQPQKGLLTSAFLAARYAETVKGLDCPGKENLIKLFSQNISDFQGSTFIPRVINPVIIGFAETATALGHAFFDCFEKAEYFHTTREEIAGLHSSITFEEEHSHATSHRCYIPIEMINNDREIILVDDEMTTGKTALNIIQSIHQQFPRKEYTVVSILDWRTDEHKQQFAALERMFGITINIVSLIAGEVTINQKRSLSALKDDNENDHEYLYQSLLEELSLSSFFKQTALSSLTLQGIPFIQATGRFGISSADNSAIQQQIAEAASFLKQKRTGGKTLCLGTGEFMYIPMKIAAEMGKDVFYQSTTRSPVFIQDIPDYGARFGIQFPNPEDNDVSHFVYNIPPGKYDELFIFIERKVDEEQLKPFLFQLEKLQIKSIKIVFFSSQ
ncbi:phosphoribosyltransferase family protein [Neobacillus sp. K501]